MFNLGGKPLKTFEDEHWTETLILNSNEPEYIMDVSTPFQEWHSRSTNKWSQEVFMIMYRPVFYVFF